MAQFLKTSTAAAAPVALCDVIRNFHQATVIARKSLDGSDAGGVNTGSVFLGNSAAAGEQPLELTPGDQYVFKGPGDGLCAGDLSRLYLKVATDGDGVVVIYS